MVSSIDIPQKAMLLAAGLGTRMRPITDSIPKPMVMVAGQTMLDRALDKLGYAGVDTVVVNTSYKAEIIESHLASRRGPPRILISREDEPLETGGGILHALPLLGGDPFYVMNGDIVYTDGELPALARLALAWRPETMDALLLVHPVASAIGYDGKGDFFLDEQGYVTARGVAAEAPYVFTGVQLFHPRLLDGRCEKKFPLGALLRGGRGDGMPRIHAIVHDGAWLHVGDLNGLKLAEEYLSLSAH